MGFFCVMDSCSTLPWKYPWLRNTFSATLARRVGLTHDIRMGCLPKDFVIHLAKPVDFCEYLFHTETPHENGSL